MSPSWVVTAAHCLKETDHRDWVVTLGEWDTDNVREEGEPEVTRLLSFYVQHPGLRGGCKSRFGPQIDSLDSILSPTIMTLPC